MAKFYGYVGFAEMVETAPGVHRETYVEYPYYGDLKQDLRKLQPTDTVNDTVVFQNLVEIMGDKYAYDHYFAMRYVRVNGVNWKVGYVEVRYPRLWIRFGEVWNGQTADTAPGTPGGDDGASEE